MPRTYKVKSGKILPEKAMRWAFFGFSGLFPLLSGHEMGLKRSSETVFWAGRKDEIGKGKTGEGRSLGREGRRK